jgi:hypothetical protein
MDVDGAALVPAGMDRLISAMPFAFVFCAPAQKFVLVGHGAGCDLPSQCQISTVAPLTTLHVRAFSTMRLSGHRSGTLGDVASGASRR